jgi:hypothetical protein
MRLTLFVLLFAGVALVLIGFIRTQKYCPPPKIEYRWVPRSFVEEQQSPVPVTDIFASMFYESTPFINTESSKLLPPPTTQQMDINKFFISQI